MKKSAAILSCIMLLTLTGCTNQQNTNQKTSSATNSNSHETAIEAVANMQIGWNLGNTLDVCAADRDGDGMIDEHPEDGEETDETLWGNVMTTPELFQNLKQDGINAVRIPVTWRDHISGAPNYEIHSDWMARVHEVVEYALDADMYVIINIHHDGGEDSQFGAWICNAATDYQTTAEKYAALWTQIAESFADYSDKLIFESMNEVGFDNLPAEKAYDIVNHLNQLFVKTVRKSNPTRNLLIAGYWTDIEKTCNVLYQMPEDTTENALIVSVHYYTPWEFCTTNIQTSWGTSEEVLVMKSNVQKLKETFVDSNIPVIVGEYGTGNGNDTASRLYFAELFTKLCYDNDIKCFYWDNGGEYDRVQYTWRTDGLIAALQRAVSGEDYEVQKS